MRQRTRTRTISSTGYTDTEGRPLAKEIMGDITQFQVLLALIPHLSPSPLALNPQPSPLTR